MNKIRCIRTKYKTNMLARVCEHIESTLESEIKKSIYKRTDQLLRNRDLDRIIGFVSEVDFATAYAFPMIFALKKQDEEQLIDLG